MFACFFLVGPTPSTRHTVIRMVPKHPIEMTADVRTLPHTSELRCAVLWVLQTSSAALPGPEARTGGSLWKQGSTQFLFKGKTAEILSPLLASFTAAVAECRWEISFLPPSSSFAFWLWLRAGKKKIMFFLLSFPWLFSLMPQVNGCTAQLITEQLNYPLIISRLCQTWGVGAGASDNIVTFHSPFHLKPLSLTAVLYRQISLTNKCLNICCEIAIFSMVVMVKCISVLCVLRLSCFNLSCFHLPQFYYQKMLK